MSSSPCPRTWRAVLDQRQPEMPSRHPIYPPRHRLRLDKYMTLWRALAFIVGAFLALPATLPGALDPNSSFTLEELENAPALTPKQFANLFEHFQFAGSAIIQPPEPFLRDRSGDCDDYATLADLVLRKKGYDTRLIRILFSGSNIGHAVCYVKENKAYLDYNNRKYFMNLEKSGSRLREIAKKVAASFEQEWTTAAEYTYSYDTLKKSIKMIVVKTDPPERDPDR